VLADLDSNGWPQSPRHRAIDLMRRSFAIHLSGDQHLAVVAQYGIDDFRDSGYAFCVPSIVNYYPREWKPAGPPVKKIEGPLPLLGDYIEGLGNKLTMLAYANPTAFPAPLDNLAASASGHGLVRFDKETRRITIECWPRGVDVTQAGARQYTGWPVTIGQEDNYGRAATAWLPRLNCNTDDPVVQVVDEANGEVVYTLRINGRAFSPKVFREGRYTVRVGEGAQRKEWKNLAAKPQQDASTIEVRL
jgi:hypothetical protein